MYADYCFISGNGHVLAEESLLADRVNGFAQRLARRHQTVVYIWIAGGEPVTPDKCNCGAIMPESGPCWNCTFEGEESGWIPFDGRPLPGPERTPKDFIGL